MASAWHQHGISMVCTWSLVLLPRIHPEGSPRTAEALMYMHSRGIHAAYYQHLHRPHTTDESQ